LIDERFAGQSTSRNEKDDMRGDGGGFGGGGGGVFGDPGEEPSRYRMADSAMGLAAAPATAELAMSTGREMQMAKSTRGAADEMLGQRIEEPGDEPAVQVRTDFSATLLWKPDLITDEDGTAHVTLKYADSLTTWLARARAVTNGYQFGWADTTTRTKMPLIARLQAPRFFVVGDVVVISGVINNNTDEALNVSPELKAEGLTLLGVMKDGVASNSPAIPIEIAANSEARVDWQVSVEEAGPAKLILTARGGKHADAMEKSYTVYEHGIERFIANSGKVRANEVTVKLDIPRERKPESTVLAVQVTPSMAVTMLDALPYLIDYPYGCTEQTMSRFLPAAITAKTLKDLGVNPETVMNKMFGGIEPQFADKTHPKNKKDLNKLQEITNGSLARLYDFQHDDGGWGWWWGG
jgi:uncharacterized protein YfaS (alpha-2-macroglobulin family)